jgi:type I restriction enzyme, S subunit
MKWDRVAIDSIAHTVTKGTTPTSIGYEFSSRGIPFLRVNNIQGGDLDVDDILFIDSVTDEALKRSRIRPKDVLLSIAGTIGKTAVVPDNAPQMNCNQAVAIIRLKENALPKYLSYWLNTNDAFRQISGSKVTGTISNLSLGCIKNLEIPLPPLEEQRRIAAILDKADGVRRKRKEAIRLTEELLKSTFLDLFGDPVTNPKGWEESPLAKVCERVTVGYVGSMVAEYIDQGIPWLRSMNVKRNRIVLDDLKFVSSDFHKKVKKSSLFPGDVVSVRTGNAGVAAVIPDSLPESNCADLIIMTCGKTIQPNYLTEALNLLLGDRDGGSGLTGAIQKHFNITRAKQLLIPVPPLGLQEKWNQIVDHWKYLEVKQVSDFRQSENLFNSLLQRAFRGEL